MDSKQLKLMITLAKKLKVEKRNKEQILNSFVSAGILTAKGNYTKNYSVLRTMDQSSEAE